MSINTEIPEKSDEFADIDVIETFYDFIDIETAKREEIRVRLQNNKYLQIILYISNKKRLKPPYQDINFNSIKARNLLTIIQNMIIPVLGESKYEQISCRLPISTDALNENDLISLASETYIDIAKFAIDQSNISFLILKQLGLAHLQGINISVPKIAFSDETIGKYSIYETNRLSFLETQIKFISHNIDLYQKTIIPQLKPQNKKQVTVKQWQPKIKQKQTTHILNLIKSANIAGYYIAHYMPSLSSTINIKNDNEVNNMIKQIEDRQIIEKSTHELNIEKNKIFLHNAIIQEKIKKEIDIDNIISLEDLLGKLTPNDAEIVKIEYNNKIQHWQNITTNKCNHVGILRKMRKAKTIQIMSKYFNQLNEEYVQPSNKTWLICNVCGFNIMCPHEFDKREMEINHASQQNIRKRMITYSAKSSFGNEYHCKICSEITVKIDIDRDIDVDASNPQNALLRSKTWSLFLILIRYIRFNLPTNERTFIQNSIAIVLPFIITQDTKNEKKRRRKVKNFNPTEINSDNEIVEKLDPRSVLTIITYVFAYFLILAEKEIGFENVKPNSKASAYIPVMISIINKHFGASLAMIDDISNDFIKSKIIEAYRQMTGNVSKIQSTDGLNIESIFKQMMQNDKIYKYAEYAYRLDNKGKEPEFKDIMSKTPNQLLKESFALVKNPELSKVITRRSGLDIPQFGTFYENLMRPEVNIMSNIYKAKNTKHLPELTTYNIFADYISGTKKNKQMSALYNTIDDIIQENKKNVFRAVSRINFNETKDEFIPVSSIALILDENKQKHVWDIYVYNDGTKIVETCKCCEIPLDTIIIEKKCSVCKRTQAELLEPKTIKIIEEALEKKSSKSFIKLVKKKKIIQPIKENIKPKYIKKIDWSGEYSIVTKLAKELNIPVTLIDALGIYDGYEFNKISQGIKFPEIKSKLDINVMSTLSEMRKFRELYYQAKLPDIPYFDTVEFQTNVPVKRAREYIIQKICEWALLVIKQYKEEIKNIIMSMVEGQRLLTQPESTNITLIERNPFMDEFIHMN